MPMALRSTQPNNFNMGGALSRIVAGDQPPFDLGDIGFGGIQRRNPLTLLPANPGALLAGAVDEPPAMPSAMDTSPPGLPPANMPGGNQPTPIVPADTRPDYSTMLREALGPRPELHGFRKVASILGPALMAATGNQAGAAAMIEGLRRPGEDYDRRMQEGGLDAVKWRRADDEARRKQNEPQYFSGSEDRVRYDPSAGTAERIYDAPQDFEDYAAAQGAQQGTQDYYDAVDDYVLRGNGPTAFKYDRDLETLRQAGRASLEAGRQDVRRALTIRGQDMTDARGRRGQDIGSTDRRYLATTASADRRRAQDIGSRDRNRSIDVGSRDRRESASFRGTGGRGGRAATSRARAVDPRTKRAIVLDNGKWVDEATGKPVS